MKLKLPEHVVTRERKGRVAFYYHVKRRRPEGWQPYIPLPDDLQEVFRHAEVLKKRLKAEREGKNIAVFARGSLTLIIRAYQNSPEYKSLAPITRRGYEQSMEHILKWCKRAGHPHVKFLTRPVILKYLDKFHHIPTMRKKIGGMIRILCAKAIDMGELTVNPAMEMNLKENRKPAHIYNDDEVERLVKAAIARKHPEMAKAIITAYSIGQREGDILRLQVPQHYKNGIFSFVQNKTGERMEIPAPAELRPYLDDVTEGPLIGRNFKTDWFQHLFAKIRKDAGVTDAAKFMHFRHSACVRLARAGNTVPEIAAVSGHSLQSATAILKRYLPRDPVVAQNAIKKLDKYQKKIRATQKKNADLKGPEKSQNVAHLPIKSKSSA